METAAYAISKIKAVSAAATLSALHDQHIAARGAPAAGLYSPAHDGPGTAVYEGIEVGEGGSVGLITYMRTDSTNVSELAQAEARQFIAQRYGESFMPAEPPKYRTKARGAQEAHEAIRPTSVMRQPEQLKPFLERDQFRLYQVIWQRFIASQMPAAIYDTLSVEVTGKTPQHEYLFAPPVQRCAFGLPDRVRRGEG
jgi:DNA topoisomerase-1